MIIPKSTRLVRDRARGDIVVESHVQGPCEGGATARFGLVVGHGDTDRDRLKPTKGVLSFFVTRCTFSKLERMILAFFSFSRVYPRLPVREPQPPLVAGIKRPAFTVHGAAPSVPACSTSQPPPPRTSRRPRSARPLSAILERNPRRLRLHLLFPFLLPLYPPPHPYMGRTGSTRTPKPLAYPYPW